MTFIAGMAVGAAVLSAVRDVWPWLKLRIRFAWHFLGAVEEII